MNVIHDLPSNVVRMHIVILLSYPEMSDQQGFQCICTRANAVWAVLYFGPLLPDIGMIIYSKNLCSYSAVIHINIFRHIRREPVITYILTMGLPQILTFSYICIRIYVLKCMVKYIAVFMKATLKNRGLILIVQHSFSNTLLLHGWINLI